jgi:hypothetical protein
MRLNAPVADSSCAEDHAFALQVAALLQVEFGLNQEAGVRSLNGNCQLWFCGAANHVDDWKSISIFLSKISAMSKRSYGVAYLLDDESIVPNRFQVFCIKNGSVIMSLDDLLFPDIPL